MTGTDFISRLPFEIKTHICKCIFKGAITSLMEPTHVADESATTTTNAAIFEQSIDDLNNLSLANKHWRIITHPVLDKIPRFILQDFLKPAPWQIAETQLSHRRTREGLPPREEQSALCPYIDSLCKLPAKFRPWAVAKTAPSTPYKLENFLQERGEHWAWWTTPVAREILLPALNIPPIYLDDIISSSQPEEQEQVHWIEGDFASQTLHQILIGFGYNLSQSLVMLLKAMDVDKIRLRFKPNEEEKAVMNKVVEVSTIQPEERGGYWRRKAEGTNRTEVKTMQAAGLVWQYQDAVDDGDW
ncbi:uncharacterized protein KY384_000851 [Bacidia gigantensis]|uniref:uncharacterized protein n=1 Tax=Bacidia gigantensis TaxID=2732470 RepID=UPI001D045ED6|nr:uncharacterized protein KY384_000851 [Bacidia gigantensis]KAG8534009.1 hypothetical protein KY384_000851 [Bacidia gigantensis]